MREIRFRAWDIDLRKMYFMENGDFYIGKNGANTFTKEWINELIVNGFTRDGLHKQKIIMQFTGLHDRNGTPIYEGDIINVHNWGMTDEILGRTAVIWDTDECGWRYEKDEWTDGDFYDQFRRVEVIGNIYEHPHLLEGG